MEKIEVGDMETLIRVGLNILGIGIGVHCSARVGCLHVSKLEFSPWLKDFFWRQPLSPTCLHVSNLIMARRLLSSRTRDETEKGSVSPVV